ncbi:A/G-specific adenine glycosylase [Chitinivorax sp. B]|uniref:A/G-specific adenine glycosylase n=1 Tax=Chitinivorax sp. B TaxID=2502235 RepID=UPI0020173751|nr:A/G-specific adenine glycosylase [Chitinivorax sp. B]
MKPEFETFARRLIAWQQAYGRHDLPWQTNDPYRVWLSEIMLQQTQVATVIPYYEAFLARFPTIQALADAPADEVMAAWSGLGYYTRARNLHRAAKVIVEQHGGLFPQDIDQVQALPGIGRSTAAAICAFSFNQSRPILDGNVKRVLTRWLGIEGFPGEKKIETRLWDLADKLVPTSGIAAYTQAQMDLGSLVCTRSKPNCNACPVATDCVALHTGRTTSLPTPKPRKAVPIRHTTMLLLWRENELLLQKRPDSGIWGGLWCLPEVEASLAAGAWCEDHDLELDSTTCLPEFEHVFTHFRLTISPVQCEVSGQGPRSAGPWQWFEREAVLAAGIPQPLRKLLSGRQVMLL